MTIARINVGSERFEHTFDHLSICVDEGVQTLVIELFDDSIEGDASRPINALPIAEADWLAVSIAAPDSIGSQNSQITGNQTSMLQVACTDKSRVFQLQHSIPTSISFKLGYRIGDRNHTHIITIRDLTFTTNKLNPPTVQTKTSKEVPVSRHVPNDTNIIPAGELIIEQATPPAPLKYRGGDLRVVSKIEAKVRSPFDLAGTEINTFQSTAGNEIEDATWEQADMILPLGQPIRFICGLEHRQLFDIAKKIQRSNNSANEVSMEIQLTWNYRVSLIESEPNEAGWQTKSAICVITLRQDEYVVVDWIDREETVPSMTEDGGNPSITNASHTIVLNKHKISEDSLVIPLKLTPLLSDLGTLVLNMNVESSSGGKYLVDTSTTIDLSTNHSVNHTLDLGELLTIQTLATVPETFNLRIGFSVTLDGTQLSGALKIPMIVSGNIAEFAYCMDFGGSATTVWCGQLEGNTKGSFLPLSDWAYHQFGTVTEYDPALSPFGNALLPTIISLDSHYHLRSQQDKLSLGIPERVGFDEDCASRRLIDFDRRYDLSIPAENHLRAASDHSNDSQGSGIALDFKRRLMEGKSIVCQGILENLDGQVSKIDVIKPRDVLDSLFSEFASYIIPNGQLALANKGNDEALMYREMLQAEPRRVKTIFTHPTGMREMRPTFESFEQAARSFTKQLLTSEVIAEPVFVPEALAAAYRGIMQDDSQKGSTLVHYACMDIGSSTVDATILSVQYKHGAFSDWDVISHFGIPIGGMELDAALLDIINNFLEAHFGHAAGSHADYKYRPEFTHEPLSRMRTLRRCIERAKEELSTQCYGFKSASNKSEQTVPFDKFNIDVSDIVASARPGQSNGSVKDDHGITLTAHADKMSNKYILSIPASLLNPAKLDTTAHKRDPRLVARLLGQALPLLLAREAKRHEIPELKWIVTGRTSLWPSIFYSIRDVVQETGGRLMHEVPDNPSIQKQAVARGAVSIVADGRDIPIGPTRSYAVAEVAPSTIQLGSLIDVTQIRQIKYLDTKGKTEGCEQLERRPGQWLVRTLPGLDQPCDNHHLPREEIINLLGLFDQPVLERKKAVAQTSQRNDSAHNEILYWEWTGQAMRFRNNGLRFTDTE